MSVAFEERAYQAEALIKIDQGFRTFQSQLLVLPTGAGKTITFAKLVKNWTTNGKRCLILAHREELLTQAQDKLYRAEGVVSSLERAGSKASLGASVVVGSVQTMYRPKRLERWPADHFDLIIVDEAHRTLAKTYQEIIEYFASAYLLGVTATPDRADKKNLSRAFENVAYEVSLKELIEREYLSPIRVASFPVEVDLASVKSTSGDYDRNEIAHAIEPLLVPIAKQFVKHFEARRKALVFLPLRCISWDFCQILKGMGIHAAHIDGESKDRREILADFASGKIEVLCNAMLLTEGYDEPAVDTIMCLRPTKSRALYAQMIGRGTRISPGKDHLLVIDPLWMSETHALTKPAHLVAETKEDAQAVTEAIVDADYLPGVGDEAIDLLEATSDARESRIASIEKRLKEKKAAAAKCFDPVTYALKVMESSGLADYEPTMGWERAKPTDKQIETLERMGVQADEIQSRGHASKLLDSLASRQKMGLATAKQVFWLHKLKVPNANTLTRAEAGRELDARFGSKKSAPSQASASPSGGRYRAAKHKRDVFAEFAQTLTTYKQ